MTPQQASLFETTRPLSPSQTEVLRALRRMGAPGCTADIERALLEHGAPQQRNCIARRLDELLERGLVERVGHDFSRRGSPTTWRRL
jgi:DNA-binding MarR family transcriptional regulator